MTEKLFIVTVTVIELNKELKVLKAVHKNVFSGFRMTTKNHVLLGLESSEIYSNI